MAIKKRIIKQTANSYIMSKAEAIAIPTAIQIGCKIITVIITKIINVHKSAFIFFIIRTL